MSKYVDADKIIAGLLTKYPSVRDPMDKVGVHEVIKMLMLAKEDKGQDLDAWVNTWIEDIQSVVDGKDSTDVLTSVIDSMKMVVLGLYDEFEE